MTTTNLSNFLKQYDLSNTDSRRAILELFLASSSALSHFDIEKNTNDRFDRVTVYRTLQVFIEKGIIHTIPTADNTVIYALCKDECSPGLHQHNHIHFICEVCEKTTCIDETSIPFIPLPEGYASKQVNVVVNGTCKACL